MFFTKSIGFEDEEFAGVAVAAEESPRVYSGDLELLEKLKAGDEEAFEFLMARYSPEIYGLLFRLTQNVEDALDLSQETFLNALRSIKHFRGDSSLKTWLYRIAINQSRNRFRWWKRRKRGETISLDSSNTEGALTLEERIASDDRTPEENTLQEERTNALRTAVAELPRKFREAIVLRDVEGLSYEEISKALDTNIGTVKSRLARGREELRLKLKDF